MLLRRIARQPQKDARVAQTEEEELAALEAELVSLGAAPSQHEQTATESGVAASEPNMASTLERAQGKPDETGPGVISSAWTETEEDEMQDLLGHLDDDAEPSNSPAKRMRLT